MGPRCSCRLLYIQSSPSRVLICCCPLLQSLCPAPTFPLSSAPAPFLLAGDSLLYPRLLPLVCTLFLRRFVFTRHSCKLPFPLCVPIPRQRVPPDLGHSPRLPPLCPLETSQRPGDPDAPVGERGKVERPPWPQDCWGPDGPAAGARSPCPVALGEGRGWPGGSPAPILLRTLFIFFPLLRPSVACCPLCNF